MTTVYDKARTGYYDNKLTYNVNPESGTYGVGVEYEAYEAQENRLQAQLRSDLEEEFGFVNHPKADDLWNLAWTYGRESGPNAIALFYDELSVLLS